MAPALCGNGVLAAGPPGRARRHPRARRAVALSVVLAGLAAAAALRRAPSAFSAAPAGPTGGDARVDASRRSALRVAAAAAAAAVASPQLGGVAPARAAGTPAKLEVSGLGDPHSKANGAWSVVPGNIINSRAVYKRDGEDIYLMFNDCGQFQIGNEAKGACTGFATEQKGKWTIDGNDGTVKIKPVSASKDAKQAPEAGEFKLGVQLPKVGFTGKESDSELLFGNGVNVGNYIKAKGGGSFIENAMTLNDEESALASKLEGKLGSITYDRKRR